METIGEILQYAQDHGVWPVLFFSLVLGGIPWLLKREKASNDQLKVVQEKHMEDVKGMMQTTNQIALTFNDTVNKFNGTIEGHTKQMETHAKQIEKISDSVNNLATSVSNVLDRTAQNQYEQIRLREDNQRILDRINTTSDLIQQLTKQTK